LIAAAAFLTKRSSQVLAVSMLAAGAISAAWKCDEMWNYRGFIAGAGRLALLGQLHNLP
jgi:hypothetical protein